MGGIDAGKGDNVEPELVAGRECGSCNVCCVALTIDDPELKKPQGYRCRNALPDNSCAIYATRPHTCREFYCGWRQLKWIRETLRPDRSGVLVRLHVEVSDGTPRMGVVFSLLTHAALKADGLAETIAAGVLADVPVFLHVPGPPGYTASQVRINEAVQHAVLTKDKPALLQTLRRLRAIGRAARHEPIVLARQTDGGVA
ncbi:MAG TPA: hypothetical protein VFE41_35990 [Acetobacteraceae bacterium]|nr:hypothetical protein [Acetobacteraceae bacterium]